MVSETLAVELSEMVARNSERPGTSKHYCAPRGVSRWSGGRTDGVGAGRARGRRSVRWRHSSPTGACAIVIGPVRRGVEAATVLGGIIIVGVHTGNSHASHHSLRVNRLVLAEVVPGVGRVASQEAGAVIQDILIVLVDEHRSH